MHGDRVGTFGRETDANQNTTATKQYDAFGMPIASTGASVSPFGFAGAWGYQEDQDSGLKLLGHRYYDPSTGRFLTRDPAKDGRNWYTYCANNPLRWVDDDGCKKKLIIVVGNLVAAGGDVRREATELISRLEEEYGDDYDITIIAARNPEDVDYALETADAVIIIGHGWGLSLKHGRKSWDLDRKRARHIAARRVALGKGKLDFVRIYSCGALAGASAAANWLLIAHWVFGYESNMYWPHPDRLDPDGNGEWYSDEIDPADIPYAWCPPSTRTPPTRIGGVPCPIVG